MFHRGKLFVFPCNFNKTFVFNEFQPEKYNFAYILFTNIKQKENFF